MSRKKTTAIAKEDPAYIPPDAPNVNCSGDFQGMLRSLPDSVLYVLYEKKYSGKTLAEIAEQCRLPFETVEAAFDQAIKVLAGAFIQ